MKAVILAGGLGKRLESVNKNIPKPMTLIGGKPVLEHQIETLKKEGIADFIFIVGHLSHIIEDYFDDGSRLGVNITYFYESEPLGTAGALFKMNFTEDFLLCNGDLIFDFNVKRMLEFHRERNALATLFTHPNSHPYDSTLVHVDEEGRVLEFILDKNRKGDYRNLCNAGIQIISPELLSMFGIVGYASLDCDVIMPAVATGRIFSYKSAEYVHDMGTPERLCAVEKDMIAGTVENMHRDHLQKAIFLDRDGTVNKQRGFITNPDEIELENGVAEAISRFHSMGYLVIIVTNQPVIARGECTAETLDSIHNRLEMLLGKEKAYVDGIYYCPHHPDGGFEGEVRELKICCNCRKPAPGLLLKAQKDFNIDMSVSFMVGDSLRDVGAGKNAGTASVLLGAQKSDNSAENYMTFSSLYDFSEYLLNENR